MEEGDYFSVRIVKKERSLAEYLVGITGTKAGDEEKEEIRYSSMIAGKEEEDEGI